eukprot:TRINITY_DN62492_c0_g1_i1.p1 TRINITY_DN62492_c0_g1~~TRINITY_DN62492_c0_g1_i1.p1  ORF type:complete len:621 (+),score=52.84 TRINITY_DN62492_c0_g1_i1:204-1865(+)
MNAQAGFIFQFPLPENIGPSREKQRRLTQHRQEIENDVRQTMQAGRQQAKRGRGRGRGRATGRGNTPRDPDTGRQQTAQQRHQATTDEFGGSLAEILVQSPDQLSAMEKERRRRTRERSSTMPATTQQQDTTRQQRQQRQPLPTQYQHVNEEPDDRWRDQVHTFEQVPSASTMTNVQRQTNRQPERQRQQRPTSGGQRHMITNAEGNTDTHVELIYAQLQAAIEVQDVVSELAQYEHEGETRTTLRGTPRHHTNANNQRSHTTTTSVQYDTEEQASGSYSYTQRPQERTHSSSTPTVQRALRPPSPPRMPASYLQEEEHATNYSTRLQQPQTPPRATHTHTHTTSSIRPIELVEEDEDDAFIRNYENLPPPPATPPSQPTPSQYSPQRSAQQPQRTRSRRSTTAPFATSADLPVARTPNGRSTGGTNNSGWEIDDFSYENLLELGSMAVCVGLTKQQIARIPTYPYSDMEAKKQKLRTTECTICLELFEEGEQVMQLVCNHGFHVPCVTQWLSKNKKCPTCRNEVGRQPLATSSQRPAVGMIPMGNNRRATAH